MKKVIDAPNSVQAESGLIILDVAARRYEMVVGHTFHEGDVTISCPDGEDPDVGGPNCVVDLLTGTANLTPMSDLDYEDRTEIVDLLNAGRMAPRFEVGTLLVNGEPA